MKNTKNLTNLAIKTALDLIPFGGAIKTLIEELPIMYTNYHKNKLLTLLEMIKNENEDAVIKLLKFIEADNNLENETIFNLIKKTINSDNKIHIFLLSKLYINYCKENSFSYYEESLFNGLLNLSFQDFKVFYQNSFSHEEAKAKFFTEHDRDTYTASSPIEITVIKKFIQLGIVNESTRAKSPSIVYQIHLDFHENEYTKIFKDYLKDFFENET